MLGKSTDSLSPDISADTHNTVVILLQYVHVEGMYNGIKYAVGIYIYKYNTSFKCVLIL